MRFSAVLLLGLCVLFFACSSDRHPDSSIEDPAEAPPSNASDLQPAPGLATADGEIRKILVQKARIGLLERGSEDWFGEVRAIAVDGFKRVYVADTYAHDVRVFDSLGVHVRTIGREGRGPGEFLWPVGLTWQNEATLWVLDLGNVRYSLFDTSGVHLRDHRRFPLGTLGPWWHAGFQKQQLVEPKIGGGYRLVGLDPDSPGVEPQDTFPYPLDGIPLDEWNPVTWIRNGETVRGKKIPFSEGFEWALDPTEGVWIGDTRRYRLVHRTLAGDTLLIVSKDILGPPVSDSEKRTAIEALGTTGRDFDPSMIPDRKPLFRLMIPADDGGIWLLREGKGSTWLLDVLDRDGRITATAEVPVEPDPGVLPVVRDGEVWIVAKGGAEVRFVVRFTLM